MLNHSSMGSKNMAILQRVCGPGFGTGATRVELDADTLRDLMDAARKEGEERGADYYGYSFHGQAGTSAPLQIGENDICVRHEPSRSVTDPQVMITGDGPVRITG